MSTTVLYTRLPAPLSPPDWEAYLLQMPADVRARILRMRHWQDQHRTLLGRLLLQEGLSRLGREPGALEQVRYTAHGRPYLPAGPAFSIGHAGEWVACAISEPGPVGLDLEPLRDMALEDFSSTMSLPQWTDIRQQEAPASRFLSYWTVKESAIKADGRGLAIDLADIWTDFETVRLEGKQWHLHPAEIAPGYACWVCAARPFSDLKLEECRF